MSDAQLKLKDIAWSESIIYGSNAFSGKYNPDDLVGRKGFAIYKKMLLDDQVKAVVLFKRDAITSRDYLFVPHDNLSGDENDRRINVFNEALEQMDGTFFNALNGIMSAMYNGFSLTEKIYRQFTVDNKLYWGIQALKIRPFDTFKFKVDEYGNIEALIQEFNNKTQKLDIRDFIYLVNRPDVDDHYGQSELREAYRDWFSKDIAIKFRNIWLEKHATGYRWVEPAADTDKKLRVGSAEYNAIVDMLNSKTAGSGFILPSGYTLKFTFPSNNVAFDDAISSANMGISRCLLVPNLLGISEQGKYGSRALGVEQLDAFFWTLDTIANNLSSALNTQLFEELGDANWGDGEYPRFTFKPVSEKRKMEIVEKWMQLVEKGTVRATNRDEDHLRELLEFPQKHEEGEDNSSIDSLDAQQISALVDITSKIKSKQLDKGTAILVILHTLPLNREEAEELVNSIKVDVNVAGDNNDNNNGGDSAGDNPSNVGDNDPQPVVPKVEDETIVGRSTKTIVASPGAYTRALKRVAFAVIAQNTDDIIALNVMRLSSVIDQGVKAIFENIEDLNSVDVSKVTFPGRIKTKLRSICRKFLDRGWNLGIRHAQDEIDKSRGQRFTRIDFEVLGDQAEKLLAGRSYSMAGKLSDDTADIIKNAILQGFKAGKSVDQVLKDIYQMLMAKGLVSPEAAAEIVPDIEIVASAPHRLKTLVRTGLFEAVNSARYEYFNDPELGDYVSALEFSAILDSRTTPICEALDGEIYHKGHDYWESNEMVPPLHYNCRSLLIAVTERDDWEESEPISPDLKPQEGFR
jgi:SPP1 gp7 family putative phage head morphogenesis protein